jgi:hypothetical protein
MAHPIAVRDLVEPVLGDHGTDPDRLEKDVEARIAGHGFNLLSNR